MDELERQYLAAIDQIDPPLAARDVLRKGWINVARKASAKLNKTLKFEAASKSPKRPSTQAEMPELVKWFKNLSDMMKPKVLADWMPVKPHFIQKRNQINLDIRDSDEAHIDDNDYFNRLVVDAVVEAMVENPQEWVGPLIQSTMPGSDDSDA
jgi:hypothetical protein